MENEINKALDILKSGGVILYPTDTVWGIGCDATNDKAVQKIYEIKERAESKSLIVLLDEDIKLNKYVRSVPAVAWDLVECADKPLTIIYSGVHNMSPHVINKEDHSVGIRIVKDEFCKQLVRKLNRPLVSTSANVSGEPTAQNFSQISSAILQRVDYVVNLRQQERQTPPPSSIIKLEENGTFVIIRK